MLELEFFKKRVVSETLGFLTRTGYPEAAFYVLENTPSERRPTTVLCYPMNEQLLALDGSGHSMMREIVETHEVFATCLSRAQWMVSYPINGTWTTCYAAALYDNNGELLDKWYQLMKLADNQEFLVQRCLVNLYEYPVSYQQRRSRPSDMRPVLGATVQILALRTRANGYGLELATCVEYGTEYGDEISQDFIGRDLHGRHGILVEKTDYANREPWNDTIHDALAILTGQHTRQELPDVSRFPVPPFSQPPA